MISQHKVAFYNEVHVVVCDLAEQTEPALKAKLWMQHWDWEREFRGILLCCEKNRRVLFLAISAVVFMFVVCTDEYLFGYFSCCVYVCCVYRRVLVRLFQLLCLYLLYVQMCTFSAILAVVFMFVVCTDVYFFTYFIHPDITVMVDWALKINYLFIYQVFPLLCLCLLCVQMCTFSAISAVVFLFVVCTDVIIRIIITNIYGAPHLPP